MTLTWLGTAALLLKEGDTTLAVDPFPGIPVGGLDRKPEELPDRELYRSATHVLATHGHVDHIYYIPALYEDTRVPVYATATPCATLEKHGFPRNRLHRIAPGEVLEIGPLRIVVWQSRHCKFDGPIVRKTLLSRRAFRQLPHVLRLIKLNLQYRENDEILFYDLTDGSVRVQIMGSLNLDPDTEYPTGADYLILPFQGRSDVDAYALPFVSRLAPKQILIDHYDDSFPPISAEIETSGFIQTVQERFGISCRALKKYETIPL